MANTEWPYAFAPHFVGLLWSRNEKCKNNATNTDPNPTSTKLQKWKKLNKAP